MTERQMQECVTCTNCDKKKKYNLKRKIMEKRKSFKNGFLFIDSNEITNGENDENYLKFWLSSNSISIEIYLYLAASDVCMDQK